MDMLDNRTPQGLELFAISRSLDWFTILRRGELNVYKLFLLSHYWVKLICVLGVIVLQLSIDSWRTITLQV